MIVYMITIGFVITPLEFLMDAFCKGRGKNKIKSFNEARELIPFYETLSKDQINDELALKLEPYIDRPIQSEVFGGVSLVLKIR